MDTARSAAFSCLAAKQHGVFTPRQVSEIGFSREERRTMVRNGTWVVVARSVLSVAGSPDTPTQQRWAALLEAGEQSALSHNTSAELRGLPGFHDAVVHVTKHESRWHHLELGELHCNARLPDLHVDLIDGMPVTNIARTIFDLAGDPPPHYWASPKLLDVHRKRMARALDTSLLRCGNSIELQLRVNVELCRRGRPGSKLMRELLDERTGKEWVPTESELEDLFLALCANYGIDPPLRQRPLSEERSRRIDFVYLHIGLIIEVDGRTFHESLTDSDEDRWRDVEMAALGFRVMRIRWRDLIDRADWVARQIQKALTREAA